MLEWIFSNYIPHCKKTVNWIEKGRWSFFSGRETKLKTQETCPDFEPPLTQRVPCQLIDWLVPWKWHSPFPVVHGVIPVVYGPWLPQTLWTIWKMADPQTTKIKRPNSHGPTDRSLASLDGLTLPRWVTFLLCVSFCNRIRCLAAILLVSIYRSVKIGEGKQIYNDKRRTCKMKFAEKWSTTQPFDEMWLLTCTLVFWIWKHREERSGRDLSIYLSAVSGQRGCCMLIGPFSAALFSIGWSELIIGQWKRSQLFRKTWPIDGAGDNYS